MVQIDDFLLQADLAAMATGEGRINRKTGRPVRSQEVYDRYWDLSVDVLAIARRQVGEGDLS
ncbi:hypothetical protein M231_02586 [Tremella mesenterica]|uniref:Uncharacterized protein n=1 Tax=Tremella mesenterica TaxID=5217 RepID=A0A4Q1BQC2_TREME|nr:hypothetical protein M231_02586 [Tremella mesenterica]